MANPSPTIVFEVNLTLMNSEDVGPNTNLADTGMLNPDRHVGADLQDEAIASILNRRNYKSMWVPDKLGGGNRTLVHGTQFTEYGEKAIYLKNQYGVGVSGVPTHKQLLRIISES